MRTWAGGCAVAVEHAQRRTPIGVGRCKQRAREAFAIPSNGTASAAASWSVAADRRVAITPDGIADNSFVWWVGGKGGYGHVALHLAGGTVLSPGTPDAPGEWAYSTIEEITRRWGLRLAGWTYSIDGKTPARPGRAGGLRLDVALTNIPTRVGRDAWSKCFRLMAGSASIFGINEAFSKDAKRLYLDLAEQHQLAQYGTSVTPNPVFWSSSEYRKVSARPLKLHGAATGVLARRYPGYNAGRYLTEVVLAPVGGGPEVAVLNWHLVPGGLKVNPLWRRKVRKKSKRKIRDLARKHTAAGRVVVGMGDANIVKPFNVIPGWRWLRGRGIDKLGVAAPPGHAITNVTAHTYPAPTDHRIGIAAGAVVVRATSR